MISISGTTIVSFIENPSGHLVRGSTPSGGSTLPTTTLTFATGAEIVDLSTKVKWYNIGDSVTPVWATRRHTVQATSATIATTSTTDAYVIVPESGVLDNAIFSGIDALAADDTNYITFSITNLGQAGGGSTAMLATSPAGVNTTKATGGTAVAANTKYPLTLAAPANLIVAKGDRLRIRSTAAGTSANTITGPVYSLGFAQSLQ